MSKRFCVSIGELASVHKRVQLFGPKKAFYESFSAVERENFRETLGLIKSEHTSVKSAPTERFMGLFGILEVKNWEKKVIFRLRQAVLPFGFDITL